MGKITFSENKRNIIARRIEEYDIQAAADVQEVLKDLLGGTVHSILEAEFDSHLV